MSFYSLPKDALPGDRARIIARRALLLGILATACSIWVFTESQALWLHISPWPIESVEFLLGATVFGAVMAVFPVLAALGFILALWFGVESIYRTRSRPSPRADRVIIAVGILIWFLPAMGFLASAIHAISVGSVHFVRPPRDYLFATDPIAYLEGVGFLLIMTCLFAWGAWRYWQGKLSRSLALLAGQTHPQDKA